MSRVIGIPYMKHLVYFNEPDSLIKNLDALKLAPKLTQKEIKLIKTLKEYTVIEYYLKFLIANLTQSEIINLIKNNKELIEVFI
jgi:hypothetical protein